MMERPERLICLIVGALLDIMEPALWVLAVLANLTAVQRIIFTHRMMQAAPRRARVLLPVLAAALLLPAAGHASSETERAWSRAVTALQEGDAAPLAQAFATEAAQASPIGDHVRWLLADALARRGDFAGARAAAIGVADQHPDSRLAPLSMAGRIARAGRLLRGGVPKTAGDEAERIADEARDAGIVVRALRVVGDAAARLGRYEAGARALEAAARHAPADQQPRLRIDQARFLIRAGQDKRAI